MDISAIKTQVDLELGGVSSVAALQELKLKYLGRKGVMAELTGMIAGLPADRRGVFGREVNELKKYLMGVFDDKARAIDLQAAPSGQASACDIGMPGIAHIPGHLHLITRVMRDICLIFSRMGFCIVEGPEVETEYNNFTGLNIPLDHPSRDAFDTFYLEKEGTVSAGENLLLRSHTSPVQVRVMGSRKPPVAAVVPGRVYRPDAVDASHSFMFHQIEGFLVDRHIRFSDLKGVLEAFARNYFGAGVTMRFRPHFFPFTEPSAEMDISCLMCKGAGCSSCGRKGWLEILGAGMIHPNVFKRVGYNPSVYTGFAFGMGVDRIAMLKYGIKDIRILYENDIRFIEQF